MASSPRRFQELSLASTGPTPQYQPVVVQGRSSQALQRLDGIHEIGRGRAGRSPSEFRQRWPSCALAVAIYTGHQFTRFFVRFDPPAKAAHVLIGVAFWCHGIKTGFPCGEKRTETGTPGTMSPDPWTGSGSLRIPGIPILTQFVAHCPVSISPSLHRPRGA
jgi:hypothetical protein